MNTLISLLNRLGEQFAPASVTMIVQSSVLLVILATLDYLLRNRARAIVRYSLWMLLLVKLVLPVNFSLPTSLLQLERVVDFQPPLPPKRLPLDVFVSNDAPLDVTPHPAAAPLPPSEALPVVESRIKLTVLGGVFLGWASISALLMVFVSWKSLKLHRFIKNCTPASPELNALLLSCILIGALAAVE